MNGGLGCRQKQQAFIWMQTKESILNKRTGAVSSLSRY